MSITYEPLTMTGMCRNGAQRDSGTLWHAVLAGGHGWSKALCGATPGKRGNGWAAKAGDKVTCPRCLKKLARPLGPTAEKATETALAAITKMNALCTKRFELQCQIEAAREEVAAALAAMTAAGAPDDACTRHWRINIDAK